MKLTGKYIFISTSLILIFLNLSVWIQDNHAFSVKKVLISGTSLLDAEDIIKAADIDPASHILEADVKSVTRKLEILPQIKNVRVSRIFPSSIRIQVEERNPVALIIDNGIWGVDAEGMLLPRFRSRHGLDYPVIVSENLQRHNPGERIDNARVLQLVSFLGILKESNASVYSLISELSWNEIEGLRILTVRRNVPVLFGQSSHLEKCKKLATAWQYLSVKNRLDSIKYLDLRFQNQIIIKKRAV
ncbi:MAG: hypothetical protein DWQ05_19050 [Calditrichaeota bacterium]|nr:MAG: hypothetical protein DWQ05_19050 [Calditrichota bacterium]